MKTWNKINLIGLFFLIVSIISCEDITDELVGKKPDDAKTINITMVAKSSSNPVFLSAKTGAKSTAKKLSEKYSKIDINIDWRTPKVESPEEQAKRILNAVNDGTDAIIVSCSDEEILTNAINKAVENDITVMTFDSDAPNSKRIAFYGPNDIEIGENIMTELITVMGDKGQVAILGGNQNAPNLQKRVQGVQKIASEHSGIEIVGKFYHVEASDDAIAEIIKVHKKYPELKGWAMVGGWPFFSENLQNKIDFKNIKIVAVDALPVQLQYIDNGIVDVFLGQPTFKWGEVPVKLIIQKLHLKEEIEEVNQMKLIRVSKENLGGWSRQLRAWGYKDIQREYLIK